MRPHRLLSLALDPGEILRVLGLAPDPWQQDLLLSNELYVLLNCSRQSGKSTVVAALALHTALFRAGSLTLIVSPGLRQSSELFRKVLDGFNALGRPLRPLVENRTQLELANRSRIVCLPGREATIRSFSSPHLLIIDEAARVPDDLYRSVRPMLAVGRGRLIALSTPFGQRGFFWKEWTDADAAWKRFCVTAEQCPRIRPDFLENERRSMGESWMRQEYFCSFQALEGLVYPDLERRCAWDEAPASVAGSASDRTASDRTASDRTASDRTGPASRPVACAPGYGDHRARRVGGIDFGFRNPFAAVWGVRDADDVLWLDGEIYERETSLRRIAERLPRDVTWYADPAGASEIHELRLAGFAVRRARNDLRAGIAAVTARIETDRLRVRRSGCPNLLAEAALYRYPTHKDGTATTEKPIDEHNHALAALRYLISQVDARFMVRYRRRESSLSGGS